MSVQVSRLQDAAEAVKQLQRIRAEQPLALALLWDRQQPRTSQRRAVQAALKPGLQSMLLTGGNRSSKTTAGAMVAVAYALGSAHPAVQAWGRINSIDISGIQPGPGIVCASALTAADSKQVQRAKVQEFLPAQEHRWLNRDGNGEALCQLANGGQILFKSNDAGARRYQGAAWDLFWADEEHDEPVYNEARMRLVDRGGRALLTMTPLKGLTWVYRRFVAEPDPQTTSQALHSRDNPHIPQDYLDTLLRSYGSHEAAARERGEFQSLEGRVYADWQRQVHVIADQQIPADWRKWRTIDFGTRNPFCCLWLALDPSDDTLHVYREHYQAERTLSQHAAMIKRLTGAERISTTIADPEDRGARLALAREHGIRTIAAPKSIRAGINAVAERLHCNAEGRPALVVHSSCSNLIREFENYIWATRGGKMDQPDKPLKRDDHAMDALRYACLWLQRTLKSGVS